MENEVENLKKKLKDRNKEIRTLKNALRECKSFASDSYYVDDERKSHWEELINRKET